MQRTDRGGNLVSKPNGARLPWNALVVGGLLVVAGAWGVSAAPQPELAALFPRQAEILVDGSGLTRLVLPPSVVRAVRSDLSDIRVFDAKGQQVPYLVDTGGRRGEIAEVRKEIPAKVLEVERRISEPEDAPKIRHEVYEIAVPSSLSLGESWDLVFASSRSSFVRRLLVEGLDGSGLATVLVPEASLFRLPNPLREKRRISLPPLTPETKRLRVSLQGEETSYLDPKIHFESRRGFDMRSLATVELRELGRQTVDRQTVIELERPRGLVPDQLRLVTTTEAFHRSVEVWDEGPASSDRALGEKSCFRVAGATRVESVEVDLSPGRGDRLRVVIADGDSPPLEKMSFQAVVRQPALIFSLPASTSGAGGAEDGISEQGKSSAAVSAGLLRFGGGRAFRPEYDVAALLPPVGQQVEGERAEMARRLYDPGELVEARLGDLESNPRFDPTPVLAFAQRPGASLEGKAYRWRRQVQASPSPEGLVRLRLGVEDLAESRSDLADLRILDQEDKQWAYLLETSGAAETRSLPLEEVITKEGTSVYRMSLPAEQVAVTQVTFRFPEPFFDRAFTLEGIVGKEERLLATGRLARRIGDPRPIGITFSAARLDALELSIEDGNDAPLALSEAQARLPVADVFFAGPKGDYVLLLGNPEDSHPRYELERVRDVVLAVESGEAALGPLEENPLFRNHSRWTSVKGAQKMFFWIAMLAAVLLLTFMTFKLARKEDV